jgi:hypothetical protein
MRRVAPVTKSLTEARRSDRIEKKHVKLVNTKAQTKARVAGGALAAFSQSALMQTIIGWTVSAVLCAVQDKWHIFLAVPAIHLVFNARRILFEILLLTHVVKEAMGRWVWWHKITPNLYLGSMPMSSKNHQRIFTQDLGISAVLAINEPYELGSGTLAGHPVSEAEWKKVDVQRLVISSPDFIPPAHELLHQGADWINECVLDKRTVYVHCKSGIGRSASIVLAYLVKYHGMTTSSAHDKVYRIRPYIISKTSFQYNNVLEFEKEFKSTNI